MAQGELKPVQWGQGGGALWSGWPVYLEAPGQDAGPDSFSPQARLPLSHAAVESALTGLVGPCLRSLLSRSTTRGRRAFLRAVLLHDWYQHGTNTAQSPPTLARALHQDGVRWGRRCFGKWRGTQSTAHSEPGQ